MTVKDMLLKLKFRGYDVSKALEMEWAHDIPVIVSARFKTKAGTATRYKSFGQTRHVIRLARRLWLIPGNAWDNIHDTFIHELAHVCSENIRSHGKEWRDHCMFLGGTPNQFHNYQYMGQRALKLVAFCSPCDKVWHRRNKLKKFTIYTCPGCGEAVTKM